MSKIQRVDKKITKAVKITVCVQEAQKVKLIFCAIASLQYELPKSQSVAAE